MTFRQSLFASSFLVLSFASAGIAGAAVPTVHDEGKFFSPDAIQKANRTIKQIYKESGKDLQIDTVPVIPENLMAKLNAEGKARFFVDWARYRAEDSVTKGIYVLICKNPAHLEIIIDRATRSKGFTLADRDELLARLIRLLRGQQNDAALQGAANFVDSTLRTNLGLKYAGGNERATPTDFAPATIPGATGAPAQPANAAAPAKPTDTHASSDNPAAARTTEATAPDKSTDIAPPAEPKDSVPPAKPTDGDFSNAMDNPAPAPKPAEKPAP